MWWWWFLMLLWGRGVWNMAVRVSMEGEQRANVFSF
jgi:hypothetical protein